MTTTPPEPREPSILSQYGEGYCRWCYFVVGLTYRGLLAGHQRGIASYGLAKPCPGSDTKPPRVTPYSSRKAAFRVKVPDAWCPACRQFVRSSTAGGAQVYTRHFPADTGRACLRTGLPVERPAG